MIGIIIITIQTFVLALGFGIMIWGIIHTMEDYAQEIKVSKHSKIELLVSIIIVAIGFLIGML